MADTVVKTANKKRLSNFEVVNTALSQKFLLKQKRRQNMPLHIHTKYENKTSVDKT